MKCYQITISGAVTNKGFRFSAMQMAYKLGINGFVQYRTHSSILIEAEGKKKKLQKFIDWCKHGPIGAKVDEINVEEIDVKGYTSFNIIHERYKKDEPAEPIDQPKVEKRKKSLLENFLTILELDEKKSKRRSSGQVSKSKNYVTGEPLNR